MRNRRRSVLLGAVAAVGVAWYAVTTPSQPPPAHEIRLPQGMQLNSYQWLGVDTLLTAEQGSGQSQSIFSTNLKSGTRLRLADVAINGGYAHPLSPDGR